MFNETEIVMKRKKYIFILILISTFGFYRYSGDDDWDVKFCGDGCPSSSPWRVESLNLGLPCFSTKEACLEWAEKNGYGDKPCIKCD